MPKAKKGAVAIGLDKGCLRLRWQTPTGNRRVLYLGTLDTPTNRKEAEILARQIELDLISGTYDPTLERYRPKPKSIQERVDSQGLSAVDLFQMFMESKQKAVDKRTIEKYSALKTRLKEFFGTKRADLMGPNHAEQFVEHLTQYQKPRTIRDRLATLAECWDWGNKRTEIPLNIWRMVTVRDELKQKPHPFTKEEVGRILEIFKSDRYYSCYHPYVYFLFSTGCRPAEAMGLKWSHINADFSSIWIGETITRGKKAGNTKTNKERTFPCNEGLQNFLRELKIQNKGQGNQLVFPAPEGGAMNDNNFCKRAWTKVLEKAEVEYRKPYTTRSTFISHCLLAGMPPTTVAEITGHDIRTLYRDYAGCVISRPKVPELYQGK